MVSIRDFLDSQKTSQVLNGFLEDASLQKMEKTRWTMQQVNMFIPRSWLNRAVENDVMCSNEVRNRTAGSFRESSSISEVAEPSIDCSTLPGISVRIKHPSSQAGCLNF